MKVEMIILSNYAELVTRFTTVESRMRWGVVCNPINDGTGRYMLPLGWEEELDKENVGYTIEMIDIVEEELEVPYTEPIIEVIPEPIVEYTEEELDEMKRIDEGLV